MKVTRFEAVSSIQQTLTREEASIRCVSDVNVVQKQAGTVLSDGINKYLLFGVGFMASVRELNCHTAYSIRGKN